MKKELRQWAWDMHRTIESAAERIDSNSLSDKDVAETASMLLQLDHEVRNDPEYHADSSIPTISVSLNELYDALNNRDVKALRLDNDIFRQVLSFGEVLITKEEREAMPVKREDGRTYVNFLSKMPYEQYKQVVHNLKELGAKYDPEVKQWYVEEDWEPKREQESPSQENKDTQEAQNMDENRRFKAVYYDKFERKEAFGISKNDVIDTVRQFKGTELTGKERCYIQECDAEGQYQQEGIYLVASGRDVTPVDIRLPYMRPETFQEVKEVIKSMGAKFDGDRKKWYVERGNESNAALQNYLDSHDDATYLLPKQTTPEQFKDIVSQLKQDGARYNSDKKSWYITDRNDASKFLSYLSSGSVHAKLEQNKRITSVESKDSGRELAIEPRKRDERTM